jgi:hypothetical protein
MMPPIAPKVCSSTRGSSAVMSVPATLVARGVALAGALESSAVVSLFTEQDCAVFAAFTAERDRRYPHYSGFVRLADDLLEAAPPGAASSIRSFVMPAAKTAVAAMNRTRADAR